ncbi:MAG: helix-turn-helix domain-containing protein [Actinomycetota bacterium]|nr:helix-turn-helix domain-containing protein [Actinomycetota bacterium]
MESLFDSETARHRKLPPTIRRLIVDHKAEHPRLSLGEIAGICYVGFGRRPSKHTVKRILEEEPMPLKMVRRFDPYHEIEEPMERRMAVVRLHSEGWAPKSIAGYLGMHKSTVYRVLKRWIEEGEQGLWKTSPTGGPLACARSTSRRSRPSGACLTESPPRCVPRARCASPNGHTPEPRHLRSHPGPKP